MRPRSPSCLSLRPVASVRLPPPLSPATMMRSGLMLSCCGVSDDPLEAGDAVVEPGRERLDLGHGRSGDRVAEVDHDDGDAVRRDDLAPAAVHAVVARQRHHAAAVDVVDAGDRLVVVRADDLEVDAVAVWLGDDLLGVDPQPGRGRDFFGVTHVHEALEQLGLRQRLLGGRLGQHRLAAVDVAAAFQRHADQDRLDPRVEPDVGCDVVRHDRSS